MSDRLFGIVALLGSVGYFFASTSIPTGFMVDPVGPKTFPMLVSAIAALCAVLIIIKPDDEPEWPSIGTWLKLALALGTLVAYAYTLKPLGFLIPTAVAATVLSYQIHARVLPAILTGAGLSVGLFMIFKYALGLSLVAIPKAWLG